MTALLYLDEPQRRTCNAKVEAIRGVSFTLDKTIFSPGTSLYRHPQPPDRGEAWIGGDKRRLSRISWRRDELLHALDGAVPKIGDTLRLHLDVERRERIERTHTAMHLILSVMCRTTKVVLTESAHVQGGGHFAIRIQRVGFSPALAAKWLEAANGFAAKKLLVRIEYRTRPALRDVDAQCFSDEVTHPGPEEGLRIVRVGDASALPCDGTLASTTKGMGRVVLQSARPGVGGVNLQFRVLD
ncbi:MAG: hypothetical protein HY556_00525 [Euryarchaeota archaeon]|nr:hypothetical protein [Euryarchaeota archaeon]